MRVVPHVHNTRVLAITDNHSTLSHKPIGQHCFELGLELVGNLLDQFDLARTTRPAGMMETYSSPRLRVLVCDALVAVFERSCLAL